MIRTLSFILLLLILSLPSCSKEENTSEKIVRPVKAITISPPESVAVHIFPGTTLASNETELAFQIPGQITKLPFLEGDLVSKGTELAELDPIKYQEKVNETSADFTKNKANYERASILVKDGHIAVADYDRVKSAYLMSQANYNTALNDLKNTKIYAPFAGVIAKMYANDYEYITAKQPIMLLQDVDNIDIEINVPENIIVNIKNTQTNKEKISARFDTLPNQTFNVFLKEYSSQADRQTQTFRVVFTMKRPKEYNILPGMTVSIHVPINATSNQAFYLIPSSAVFMNAANQPSVWLIDKQTMKVKSTTVTTSTFSKDQIRILNGIKPGDLIVISGVHYLQEGQEVKLLK